MVLLGSYRRHYDRKKRVQWEVQSLCRHGVQLVGSPCAVEVIVRARVHGCSLGLDRYRARAMATLERMQAPQPACPLPPMQPCLDESVAAKNGAMLLLSPGLMRHSRYVQREPVTETCGSSKCLQCMGSHVRVEVTGNGGGSLCYHECRGPHECHAVENIGVEVGLHMLVDACIKVRFQDMPIDS